MKNRKDKEKPRKRRNRKILLAVTFLTALLLVGATYAWLSTALNVKIRFIELKVASDSGLFISLDGIEFTDSVFVSMDSIVTDLKSVYPNHTNQWAATGMWPVSSNGIKTPNDGKFEVYEGQLLRTKAFNPNGTTKRLLNTFRYTENEATTNSKFISFDVFLKNATGSPKPDNLYFDNTTYIGYEEDTDEETKEEMSGILNSLRIGMVKMTTVPTTSDGTTVQNLTCNNACEMLIWEPFAYSHSENSITTAENYGVTLVDGVYNETYGMIAEGRRLEHTNGHAGTGIPLLTNYFAYQDTIKYVDAFTPIFQIPNGITKFRVYIWIEGQDIDSLETYSKGAALDLALDFVKDTAGYE